MDIRIEDIAVRFGAVQALSGVGLSFAPGQVTVLAGPNGAGKSTLLSVMLGLIRPDRGQMLVNGVPEATPRRPTSRAIRARLGYLPESVAFSENLSGRQVLRFFARARGLAATDVEQSLERIGLANAAGRPVRGYSRGMRQRLGLGVATLGSPDLLILDEPTGGLDQQGLAVLWSVLAEWRAAGRLVVLSTHDLALIERRCDQIAVLMGGRLQAVGTPEGLRKQTALPIQVRMALTDDAHATALAGQLAHTGRVRVEGTRLSLEVAPDQLLTVTRALHDAPVLELRIEEPGLDEVYEHLLEEEPCASPVH